MPSPRDLCLFLHDFRSFCRKSELCDLGGVSWGVVDCMHVAKMRSWSCKLSSPMIRVSEMSEELNYSLVPETCVYPVAGLRIPDPPNEKQLQAVGLYTILGLRACVGKHGPLLKGTEHTHA